MDEALGVVDPTAPSVVTPSVGIARSPTEVTDVVEPIRETDVALYADECDGSNNVSVSSQRLVDEPGWLSSMRTEILRGIEAGEFVAPRAEHPSPGEFLEVRNLNRLESLTRSIVSQRGRCSNHHRHGAHGARLRCRNVAEGVETTEHAEV